MTLFNFSQVVTSESQLREVLGYPIERSVRKQLNALDTHCRDFISRSPFMLLGTCGSTGGDVSPKGDRPGFVLVLDDNTIVIPDRLGNRRGDSLTNILENPKVGILFLVPGLGETLRINGTARIIRDESVLGRTEVNGKVPQFGIAVNVEQAYMHCAKAMIRSSLWKHETWRSVSDFPSLGRILVDHARLTDCTVEDIEDQVAVSYTTRLY